MSGALPGTLAVAGSQGWVSGQEVKLLQIFLEVAGV
jgi:hypothetical protein